MTSQAPTLPATLAAPSAARTPRRLTALVVLAALLPWISAVPAAAAPAAGAYLVFDARTGEVVANRNADQRWYPASITKLMTAWVTLEAIRAGRLSLSSPVTMSARAAREPPSKMGFAPGQVVTVDNALKIIMVKSANDVAWALGETVGGSKEAFVERMNAEAARLGMTRTHWGNPNGLPDPTQVTTARDLGLLARALLRKYPEADELWHLPGIQYGNEVIRNHNHLIDHYPGSDGMKTGFICSSGFNVVATASRGSRRLVAVVLGSRSARQRAELAAELFTRGFDHSGGGGLFAAFSAPATLDQLPLGPEASNPVRDVKQEICGRKRGEAPDVEDLGDEPGTVPEARSAGRVVPPGAAQAGERRVSWLSPRFDIGPPVRIWLGGVEAAPPDAGGMLALGPDAAPAPAVVPPLPAGTLRAPAPGAVGHPQNFALFRSDADGGARAMPPTGPGAGAGVAASLPPADGAPMIIGVPAAAGMPP
ncbi:D-alanyl-D-alanine carboxypeptidase family protein, partial [Siculibacillus lacustris]|uniref:D-alanyl-D-alanine carboxypeptidase family protein n=1 Tax=Siculibacillus lacustris TaxID=1549641 RepID=UPI0013F149D7